MSLTDMHIWPAFKLIDISEWYIRKCANLTAHWQPNGSIRWKSTRESAKQTLSLYIRDGNSIETNITVAFPGQWSILWLIESISLYHTRTKCISKIGSIVVVCWRNFMANILWARRGKVYVRFIAALGLTLLKLFFFAENIRFQ